MRDLYMQNGEAFVVMYSVIVASTLPDAVALFAQVERVKGMHSISNFFLTAHRRD